MFKMKIQSAVKFQFDQTVQLEAHLTYEENLFIRVLGAGSHVKIGSEFARVVQQSAVCNPPVGTRGSVERYSPSFYFSLLTPFGSIWFKKPALQPKSGSRRPIFDSAAYDRLKQKQNK